MRAFLTSLLAVAVLVSLANVGRAQANVDQAEQLKTLQERVKELEAEMAELKTNLLGLESQLKEKDEEVGDILRALSRRDSSERPILALRSIMKSSEEFRQEMSEAVNESIARQGKLRVDNRTSGVQYLSINGKSHRIEPLTTHEFDVPIGTLTTELVGQESPKNWTVTAPTYRQEIIIRPTARQVIVNSPSVIVNPAPLYVLP